jgi:polyisoprenoid-binding protein YceI
MRIPLLCVLLAWPVATQADTFKLDKQHTEVRVSWDHMGLSRQSAKFSDVTGKVEFNAEKPEASTVDVQIKVASFTSGITALDTHLTKTKDYFDAAAHPMITFKSREVRSTGEKTAEVIGDLTINGVAKPATLAVVWNFLGPHPMGTINPTFQDVVAAGFTARTQILRSDWGMSRTIPLVSDEIRIVIETEMHKEIER